MADLEKERNRFRSVQAFLGQCRHCGHTRVATCDHGQCPSQRKLSTIIAEIRIQKTHNESESVETGRLQQRVDNAQHWVESPFIQIFESITVGAFVNVRRRGGCGSAALGAVERQSTSRSRILSAMLEVEYNIVTRSRRRFRAALVVELVANLIRTPAQSARGDQLRGRLNDSSAVDAFSSPNYIGGTPPSSW
jgi:hypothetical protein